MIKKYWEITLRDYDVMEKTGNVSQFKSPYNILPTKLFTKQIESVVNVLKTKLNGGEDLQDAQWEVESYLKIIDLETNYLGIVNLLRLKSRVNVLMSYMNKKIKNNSNRLELYINRIYNLVQIKIETLRDIEKVRRKIEFLKDKFNENFKDKKPGEKIYLMALAMAVFGVNLNPHTTVMEFIEARERKAKEKPNA